MPTKKSVKKQATETVIDVQEPIEVATEDTKLELEEEKTYSNFDDVHKALVDIDKQIMMLNRARIQLSKLSHKFYGNLSKQLKKKSKSDKSGSKVNISGFNKPAQVPQSICKYLGLPADTQLPRTTVTHQLYEKIKEQNLLNADDKRVIIVNKELRDLFKMEPSEDQISFLNFQKYLSRAYNSEKKEAAEASADAEDDVEDEEDEEEDDVEEEEEEVIVEKKKEAPKQQRKK